MPRLLTFALLIAHLALFAAIAITLGQRYGERRAETDHLREQAEREHHETRALRREVAVQRAILEGLRRDDPYVVEMLARQQLGMQADPEEVSPPPMVE